MRTSTWVLFAILLMSSSTHAERPPIFEGAIVFAGGQTRMDLTDALATVPLPPTFGGWTCYIGETQRSGRAYVKTVTCGGKWGWVDAFVSCDPAHRNSGTQLRLRQPVAGGKAEFDAAEKVTISVGCGY